MKKALLLCASHNDLGLIRALRKLGYYILVTGNMQGLPGEKYADEYIQADYSDKELILKIAQENKIDAICQCCNDFGVYTAAYVAEQLELPGYDSYETTLTLHNKDRFKEFAGKYGIQTPQSYAFQAVEEALKWAETADYPLIVKPTDCSAGNGVKKILCREEAKEAIEEAFIKSRQGKIVIERFVSGSQHGFCTFLYNQKVAAYASNNEYSVMNPYRVEIDTFPADNCHKVSGILIAQIEKMASVLNLKDGIFHLPLYMAGLLQYLPPRHKACYRGVDVFVNNSGLLMISASRFYCHAAFCESHQRRINFSIHGSESVPISTDGTNREKIRRTVRSRKGAEVQKLKRQISKAA